MTTATRDIEAAIEVFVHGFSTDKSRSFPYEASRVGPLWLMRDAERKIARDYRGEEWIVHDVAAEEADAIVRQHARPSFAVSVVIANDGPDEPTRTAYKALGYRLLRTEGFFVQSLRQIPDPPVIVSIERVRTAERAAQLGKVIRRRPLPDDQLGDDAPLRVRSIDAIGATWCSAMFVEPSYRRRGIGQALMAKMLHDDKAHASRCSMLLATRAGALLYPRMGYERIGTLLIFAPKNRTSL
ncbi:GNAT family N-acetyltransferase [Mesorhizobium sp. C416B]|uniref:GNAT family N-acetyltransferase n=1 Tax=unclassified Mesorhizobium TaxID=325217 RepID=UPI0003CF6843|nr:MULTISPECIES: GNAT family N-acetyltransferase [unclassified Mesorhizobium]ESX49875.1 GCN5 family acetyltransferase [Mesorhizobium sp. LSHC426A00]ESX57307.1 GCN5 family acetyltransferase [Mesorhizobium sp. LSHC424B00]ESX75119.1 GCN5 family acetyltransferase [Mesorhizobium sp. LSHC416B00]WJI63358.1 GNAT family N-acetyltransferase [Mesorhizobium sp. C416B]